MAEANVDVDLDALAPRPKRAKLVGKRYLLPGDMPMELFFRLQAYQSRVESGEDEMAMLAELRDEILELFQVHQPQMTKLPNMGITVLLQALGATYSGGMAGEPPPPNRAARRQRKKTPSSAPKPAPRKAATSR